MTLTSPESQVTRSRLFVNSGERRVNGDILTRLNQKYLHDRNCDVTCQQNQTQRLHVDVPTKSKARKIMRALWYEHYLESTSDVALTAATDMKET